LVRCYSIPRLVVQDAVCTDAVAAGAPNGYSGIETRIWRASHKRKVAEALVLAEIVDYQGRSIARVVERQRAVLWSEIDGVVTQTLLLREYGGAKTQAIVFKLSLSTRQGQSSRGFGEEEAVSPIEEGYETSSRIQAQSSQLRKRRQGLVVGCFRGIV
jgi:hypothetical protein